MLTKKRLQLRSIAGLVCMVFVSGELRAAPIETVPTMSSQQLLLRDPSLFEAPSDFTLLSELHPGDQRSFIIHIQDAHSNFSGQGNLAGAIQVLMEKYDVSLVLSEGGWGDCSLTPMKKIASTETWKKVARRFLMSGELQGEEYLNLISDRPMKIIGIEEADLYNQGLADYQKLAEKREEVLAYLDKTRRAVEKVKSKLYPKELLEYEKFGDGSSEFGGGFEKKLKMLARLAGPSDVLTAFPVLTQLIRIQEKESTINFDAA